MPRRYGAHVRVRDDSIGRDIIEATLRSGFSMRSVRRRWLLLTTAPINDRRRLFAPIPSNTAPNDPYQDRWSPDTASQRRRVLGLASGCTRPSFPPTFPL